MKEARWKSWLSRHREQVLDKAGVREKGVVLDFGCGSGTYTLAAARLVGPQGTVYALDKKARALAKVERAAREQGLENVVTILSSDLQTHLPDGCVQVVLLHDVLHMIDQRDTLFQVVHRALCPGGRVSVYPMHVDSDEVARQMRGHGFSLQAREYEGHILILEKTEQVPESADSTDCADKSGSSV